ncbi:histidine kinase dimerization/phospho-acceptor domain-containing protein, partial [Acinetobacter baumannii]
ATQATEVDRMKSEFLTTAAHELRTPMVSVFGFTELLLRRSLPDERRRDVLETIHRQSSLLVGMLNELLDVTRLEARRGLDFDCRPCTL